MPTFTPHPYQQRGIELLVEDIGGAGLGLDPGMGKTGITLAAIHYLMQRYPGLQVLVIVPINPMYGTWPDEIRKWGYDFTYSIIHGSPKKRREALLAEADLYLINPEGVPWLFEQERLVQHPDWKLLVVDESTKFKKPSSKRFKAIRKHLNQFYWRWILTGTICPNGLEDIFGQVFVMDQGAALGSTITKFRQMYFFQTGYGGYTYVPKEGATEEVTKKIDSRVLLLKAEDYLDMPDFMKIERKVELTEDARAIYDEVESDFISEVGDSEIVAVSAAAQGIKCRQIANGAVYGSEGEVVIVHDGKLAALEEIIEETNGHPLLIMYEFQHDRDRIQRLLGKDCICVTGMTGTKLTDIVDKFNSGQIKYLLMHPGSAHGMNIQKHCHHIVWFSIIWNLEFYIQSNTRLYRQGQSSQTVMCYHLVAAGTLDKVVSSALKRKEVNQQDIERNLRRYCGVPENVSEERRGVEGGSTPESCEGGEDSPAEEAEGTTAQLFGGLPSQ